MENNWEGGLIILRPVRPAWSASDPVKQYLPDAFFTILDTVLTWDRAAAESTTERWAVLTDADTTIAGHAIDSNAVLVTNNERVRVCCHRQGEIVR